MFESRPTITSSKSRRSTAQCQTLAPSSIVTAPTRTALGATKIIRSLEVHEDVLHVRVEQHRVDPLLMAEARLLPPEERGLRESDRELVDGARPRLQAARDRVRLRDILGPDACRETVRRVVRVADRVVQVGEVPRRDDGTEDLLPGDACTWRRVLQQCGPHEDSVLQIRTIGATASCEDLRAFRDPFLDRLHDGCGMVAGDERAHLDAVFQRGAEPKPLGMLL